MHGISGVVVIVLILMITISMAGMAYVFTSAMMNTTTSAASTAVDNAMSGILTQMNVEGVSAGGVYIRNTGQSDLKNFSVYVNGVPANFSVNPSVVKTGQVGTVKIYDFVKYSDVIKIATSRAAPVSNSAPDMCAQALGCWKFDENSGLAASDSSPNGKSGSIMGATWAAGKSGSALSFNGASAVDMTKSSINNLDSWTISMWLYPQNTGFIYSEGIPEQTFYIIIDGAGAINVAEWNINYGPNWYYSISSPNAVTFGRWNYVVITMENAAIGPSGTMSFYVNGQFVSPTKQGQKEDHSLASYAMFGDNTGSYHGGTQPHNYFSGMIDEFRIYPWAV
jgi:hypothetical protein